VESAELQYGLLAGFSDELNLLLIENTLDSLEDYGQAIDELYETWLAGSYEGLMEVLEEEDEGSEELTEAQKALLEDYNDKMLTQRNLGMRDKAVQWLEAGDKVFFAVGAAHLMGEDGLVELLRAAGYTVDHNPAPNTIGQVDGYPYGHVFWVESVNGDGSINVSEYNNAYATYLYTGDMHYGDFGARTIAAGDLWQYNFIHL
jgi:hypothetical protein